MEVFSSSDELYVRVYPVLKLKKKEYREKGYEFSEEYIYKYLIKNEWLMRKNLSLAEVVDDILKINIIDRTGQSDKGKENIQDRRFN